MAMTIEEGFRQFRQNLEITDLQLQTVSTRQTRVREVLQNDFAILDSFLTGSYRRSTMIAPLKDADIDIFFVLDPKYYDTNGQYKLLIDTKTSLRKTYTQTPDIRPDGQAVTITFTDFKVDVVPGFYREGGGFLIPDSNLGRWIATDPKKHVELWSESNKKHNGNLIPLIKMLKAWNKDWQAFRSFHLEVLTRHALSGITISDFPSGVRFVFDKARPLIRMNLPDPAGYSSDVAAHISLESEANKIVTLLDMAYSLARDAERLAAAGQPEAAFAKWRTIFGDYFPAYR
jgi:hypothetical protein